jgi:signal transduction histidine kinase
MSHRTSAQIAVSLTLVAALALTGCATTPRNPPASPQAAQVQSLVEKAAAKLQREGKAAFPQFRQQNSEWWQGDVYLFVFDKNATVLFHPTSPEREGKNNRTERDADGKLFQEEFLKVAQNNGAGWVDYKFPRPGQTQPAQKWSYIKSTTIDGIPGLVGAGFYPENTR